MDRKAVANTVTGMPPWTARPRAAAGVVAGHGRAQHRSAAPYQAQEHAAGQRERPRLNDEGSRFPID